MKSRKNKKVAVTLKDVARLAGVHPSTVSRVWNNDRSFRVSEETRRTILEVIEKLNYRPNRIARSLKQKRAYVIAVAVPDITNPFFSTMFRGIEDVALERGFNVILCNTDERLDRLSLYLETLMERQVDGMILATAHREDPTVTRLREQGYAFVLVNRRPQDAEDGYVVVDDTRGAYMATEHLIQLGHRAIAHLAAPQHVMTAWERVRGYRMALEDHGIEPQPEWLRQADFTREAGYEATKKMLEELPPERRPTAVFAVNDMAALGAIEALAEAGLRVPEDMALVGYNDVGVASLVGSALTTVRVPLYEMGAAAADMLIRMLTQEDREAPGVILAPRLIIRESCGAHLRVGAAVGSGGAAQEGRKGRRGKDR